MNNMMKLCERFCPTELRIAQGQTTRPGLRNSVDNNDIEEAEEEEEEEN